MLQHYLLLSETEAKSWTTEALTSAIEAIKQQGGTCVEMEAAAFYALSVAKRCPIICFVHLTNEMAQQERDFEKGEESGSSEILQLVSYVLNHLQPDKIFENV